MVSPTVRLPGTRARPARCAAKGALELPIYGATPPQPHRFRALSANCYGEDGYAFLLHSWFSLVSPRTFGLLSFLVFSM